MKRNHHHPAALYPSRHRGNGLLSMPWLFALLILALGLAGVLIPRQSELVKRLMADGRHDRALAIVGEGMIAAVDPITGEPVALEASPANLVRVLLDSIDHDFDETSRVRIDALVAMTDDPGGVLEVLNERRRVIPGPLMVQLLDHLATRAVQTGDPRLAVSIFHQLEELTPLTLEQTRDLVAACRYAGDPRSALDAISRHLHQTQSPFTQLPDDLRSLTIALHRELNEGGRAFDLLSEEFKATLDPAQRESLVELITTVAAQSERLADSLPILKEYVADTAAGKLGWRELGNREDPADEDHDFQKFAPLLAQHLEWSHRTSEAFDLYRKLAILGDIEALDRCVTIYPWVDRQEDLTELLEATVPVVQRERYTLLLGRLQAERGHFAEAEAIYREELAGKHAGDPGVWFEFGAILDAQERFDECLSAYQAALELDDARHEVRVKLARLHVILGNYPAALLAYRKLPAEAHDRKTREDYSMIARSLDAPRDFIEAVRLKIDAEPVVEADTYLDMADAWESLADYESVEKTLREGMTRHPESTTLRLTLADFFSKQGRNSDAFELLAEQAKPGDKRFASRLLSLGYETERFEETLRLVTASDLHWSPTERLDLASLYEETGDTATALAHYRETEGGEASAARLEAEIAFARGDIDGALRRHRQFLDLLTEPDYEAWTFYGDLQRAAGHSSEAEEAYRTALEQLKLQISAQPPAVNTPPVATVP